MSTLEESTQFTQIVLSGLVSKQDLFFFSKLCNEIVSCYIDVKSIHDN